MRSETLEWALFLWPDWRDSIRIGRDKFSVKPGMSWKQIEQWKAKYGGTEFTDFAAKEMNRLRLPREFGYYWMCCLLADFEQPDGSPDFSTIRDFLAFSRKKVSPRFFLALTISPGVAAKDKDTEETPPQVPFPEFPPFKIEGFLHLVDGEMLRRTTEQIMAAKKIVTEEFPHPLASLIIQAKERVKSKDRKRQAQMLEKYRRGQATIEDLLRDEYQSEETQQDIKIITGLCGRNRVLYRQKEAALRKKVWDRVYRRVTRSGLTVEKTKAKWWLAQ